MDMAQFPHKHTTKSTVTHANKEMKSIENCAKAITIMGQQHQNELTQVAFSVIEIGGPTEPRNFDNPSRWQHITSSKGAPKQQRSCTPSHTINDECGTTSSKGGDVTSFKDGRKATTTQQWTRLGFSRTNATETNKYAENSYSYVVQLTARLYDQ